MRQTLIILCLVIGLTSGTGVLPDSVNALAGDTVTFTTSLAPAETPFATIIWTFEGVTIATLDYTAPEYEGRITLFPSTGSLELRNLALSDAGAYTVNIIPTGDVPRIGFTTLNIYKPVSKPSVTVTNTDLLEFNDTITLSCTASGSSLTFLWLNGSAEVKASDRVHFTDGGANVTIDPVLRYDQESCTCKVSNPASSSTSDPISLSVSYGPDVILKTSPSSEDHEKGSNVILSCSADSRPPAQIKWFLNGTLQSNTGTQWTLSDIQMDQRGTYSCEAFNSKTLRNLRSQPAPITVWARITNPSLMASDQPVEGATVNLTCDASGSIITREWMINGIELKPSQNIEFYNEKQVLSLRNLNRKDSGTYTCRISNPVSSDSADYTMNIIYGPENVNSPYLVKIKVGSTLRLSCSADSEPTAKYTWIKNGTILIESHEYEKKNIELSDSGEYICRATNEITQKKAEASCAVTVTEAPEEGLSTGAIAGITVASLVVVIGAAAGGFYLYQHKKNRRQTNNSRELEHVYENTSNTGNLNTEEENKHVYENSRNVYDRKL